MDKYLHEWTPRLYRFALRLTGDRHTAEDLTQEAMLRAWRERASLRDPVAGRVWLFRIAANLWRDWLRRRRSPVSRAGPLFEIAQAGWRSTDHVLSHQEELARALQTLEELPPRQREVLYLSACEGMKATEIAKILETTTDAIKASLSLARKKMRESLDESVPSPSASE